MAVGLGLDLLKQFRKFFLQIYCPFPGEKVR